MIYLFLLALFLHTSIIPMALDDEGIQFIERLLDNAHNIDRSYNRLNNKTPLEYAAENDENYDLVLRLLSEGAVIEDFHLMSPACAGASRNLQLLLDTAQERDLHMPALLNYQDPDDGEKPLTPFLHACEHDTCNDFLPDMIAHGAELAPNIPTRETCLHQAVWGEATKNVTTLLSIIKEKSPELINAQDNNGRTALHDVFSFYPKVVSHYIGNGIMRTRFLPRTNTLTIVRLLCKHNANPNLANNEGGTPLDSAIWVSRQNPQEQEILTIIKELLMHKAKTRMTISWNDPGPLKNLFQAHDHLQRQKKCLADLRHDTKSYIHALPLELVECLQKIIHAQISYCDYKKDTSRKRKLLDRLLQGVF